MMLLMAWSSAVICGLCSFFILATEQRRLNDRQDQAHSVSPSPN